MFGSPKPQRRAFSLSAPNGLPFFQQLGGHGWLVRDDGTPRWDAAGADDGNGGRGWQWNQNAAKSAATHHVASSIQNGSGWPDEA